MNDIPPWSEQAKSLKRGKYRHFKGGEYEVLQVVRHSETQEELVLYQSLEDPDRLWVRPLKMFTENVRRENYDGPRFSFLRDE